MHKSRKRTSPNRLFRVTPSLCFKARLSPSYPVSCELSFASRAGTHERAFASPLACRSRVYFSRHSPNGELARNLGTSRFSSWALSNFYRLLAHWTRFQAIHPLTKAVYVTKTSKKSPGKVKYESCLSKAQDRIQDVFEPWR